MFTRLQGDAQCSALHALVQVSVAAEDQRTELEALYEELEQLQAPTARNLVHMFTDEHFRDKVRPSPPCAEAGKFARPCGKGCTG